MIRSLRKELRGDDKLEEFLCLLAEKRDWKDIRETASAIGLPEEKLRPITLFFERFGFISLDLEGERVRINPEVLKFLDGLKEEEKQGGVSLNHDASFVEARAALPLDGGVKCRQPERVEDGRSRRISRAGARDREAWIGV